MRHRKWRKYYGDRSMARRTIGGEPYTEPAGVLWIDADDDALDTLVRHGADELVNLGREGTKLTEPGVGTPVSGGLTYREVYL